MQKHLSLERVLHEMVNAGLHGGVKAEPVKGLTVWIGEGDGAERKMFAPREDGDSAARWLADAARRHGVTVVAGDD
jgi:hypothetical protein